MAKEVIGLDLRCSQKLEGWMKEAGLVDIKKVSYWRPLVNGTLRLTQRAKILPIIFIGGGVN
jgi:hypothetical protein